MNRIVNVYKPVGMTPLQLIDGVRKELTELKDEKIGYAGRLDPLAHGVMLLMIGDATKERDKYLGFDKTYEFEVLFGIETDTYDVMGFLKKEFNTAEIVKEKVNLFVKSYIGKIEQVYPTYSSKAVNGKPLFWWARENRLSEIAIPTKAVEITQFELLEQNQISKEKLGKQIVQNISLVAGDFRQEEIVKQWEQFFIETHNDIFQTARFRVDCSSGTYVRGITNELGKFLKTGAIALEILRTKVGAFEIEDSLKLKTL